MLCSHQAHPWGWRTPIPIPSCSVALPKAVESRDRLLPGEDGYPGLGQSLQRRDGIPMAMGNSRRWAWPAAGNHPSCARLQDAMHRCPLACTTAGCHVSVPTGVLGCTSVLAGVHGCVMLCLGACQCAQLHSAMCWCPPACTVAPCHVLVPNGAHSHTVPCIGAFQHPALPAEEHAAEQIPSPSSSGRKGTS